MKRIIYLMFIIILSCSLVAQGLDKDSYIKGAIIFENFSLSPSHLEVSLEDFDGNIVQEQAFIVGSNFYFFNPPLNDYYSVKVKYGMKEKRRSIFAGQRANDIGSIKFKPSITDVNKNGFINIMLAFVLFFNILAISLMKKKKMFNYEKQTIFSIVFFTISTFIILASNILSFSNEIFSSRIIFLSFLPESLFYIFILKAIVDYSKNNKKKYVKSSIYLFILLQIMTLPAIISFVSPKFLEFMISYSDISWNILVGSILALSISEYLFLFLATVLLTIFHINSRKNKGRNKFSLYLLIFILLISVKTAYLFLLPKHLKSYFSLYIENIDLFVFVITISFLLVNTIGHKFTKNSNFLYLAFLKLIKYFIALNCTYLLLSIEEEYYLAIVFLCGFLFSDLVTVFNKITKKKRQTKIEGVTDKLEMARSHDEFKQIIGKELEREKHINSVDYIFLNTQEDINNYVKSNKKLRVMKSEDFLSEFSHYDYLIKTIYNNKVVGFILLDTKGLNLETTTIDYLMALSDSFALIVNNIRLRQLKEGVEASKLPQRRCQKEDKLMENLLLNIEFIKLIEKETDNEKIHRYCKAMKGKLEELQRGDTHE